MTRYQMSVRCPHCSGLTFLKEVNNTQFERAAMLLKPVLHAFMCEHCKQAFGKQADLIKSIPY